MGNTEEVTPGKTFIKSLEFMVKKKIILSESADETGLFHEYRISKHIKGKCEIWNGMK
jgi:hypothetical protein